MPAETGKGVAYCLDCGYGATQAEVDAGIRLCPGCQSDHPPAWRANDVTVRINWHELRILVMWAERWASALKDQDGRVQASMQKTLYGIADRLQKQYLARAPLTFMGEISELRGKYGKAVEVVGFNEPPTEGGKMICPACYGPVGPDCDKPELLLGQPLGQYHCPGCGVIQIAGVPHINCEVCDGTGEVQRA